MCLAEKRVTPRESKLLVQYVFHRCQKKMLPEVILKLHKTLICRSMIYCALFISYSN